MKDILNFLIESGKLKKMPRTGFFWLGIKNPETIAQHAFRVAILNWILALKIKPKLNLEKIIKISLIHDLCEVYAGDMTPYWGLLPKNPTKRREILKRWVRLPIKIKKQRDKEKFEKEKESLQKLIDSIPSDLKKDIMDCWLEYERMFTEEGRFVKQGDKIETLLQALEYWGSDPNSPVLGWWEEVEELVDDPILREFLEKVEKRFYQKKKDDEVDFLLKIGELKTMPRNGWVLRKVRNPETIAEHNFLFTLAVWIFGKGRFNLGKILKMSLVYEICEVYAEDKTPYEGLISEANKKHILKRWPRFSKKEKEKRFLKDYKTEKKCLEKITSKLSVNLKKEIINLWDECKKRSTLEGSFVNQVYWLTTYLQALQYFQKDIKFPILGWWEQMREFIEHPVLIRFREELEKKFLLGKKITF